MRLSLSLGRKNREALATAYPKPTPIILQILAILAILSGSSQVLPRGRASHSSPRARASSTFFLPRRTARIRTCPVLPARDTGD